MRSVVQRVRRAAVWVEDREIASIARGWLALIGVGHEDGPDDVDYLVRKLVGLRGFEDPPGKMNLSILEIGGEILAVPQFTLMADCRHGRRPDFTLAAPPEPGQELFNAVCQGLRQAGVPVKTGQFRATMRVDLENEGPVTLILDTKNR